MHHAEDHGMQFYARNGDAITLEQWAELRGNLSYCQVAVTDFGSTPEQRCMVSTVWLGMWVPIWKEDIPVLFETMVFAPGTSMDEYQWKSPTLESAIDQHDLVAMVLHYELTAQETRHA